MRSHRPRERLGWWYRLRAWFGDVRAFHRQVKALPRARVVKR